MKLKRNETKNHLGSFYKIIFFLNSDSWEVIHGVDGANDMSVQFNVEDKKFNKTMSYLAILIYILLLKP